MDRYFGTVEEEKKGDSRLKRYGQLARLYVAPLIAVGVFLTIMFGIIVPKVSTIIGKVNELETKNTELTNRRNELNAVNGLVVNSVKVLSDLDKVNEITTTEDTQIVDFRERISQAASQNGLSIVSSRIRETVPAEENPDQIENQQTLLLQEIPVIFELTGNLEDINSFIDELSQINDFVIIKTFELNRVIQEGDQWNLELQFTKYQFNETNTAIDFETIYSNVPASAIVQPDVQQYIDAR